ncbi:MAG: hypothetical protein HC918_00415 [Oscillatoriales cyanobacterium SM2_1_8]|nr:hypothetical protein [Oscillatoriales cyanobacterium SM2_1_8]
MSKAKKAFLSLFILWVLWVQIAPNIEMPLTYLPLQEGVTVYNQVAATVNRVLWLGHRAAWLAGLTGKWRMFAPVDRFNWRMEFVGIDAAGNEMVVRPAYPQRTFWERNLFDFRNQKLELNIYSNEPLRQAFARSFCRADTQKVRVDLLSRNILSPAEARAQGQSLSDEMRVNGRMGEFPCS